MPAEIACHRQIIEQVGNHKGRDVLPNVAVDAGNVALGDVRVHRLCCKYTPPFSSVRHAISVTDDFHAVRRDVAGHLIPETDAAEELLTLRRKPMVLTE